MTDSRLQALLNFYQQDPDDPFNLYALALEYAKSDVKKAREFFGVLLRDHESYLPTYYQAGTFYSSLGEKEKAMEIFEKGIEIATRAQDTRTIGELRSAYEELMW